MDVILDISSYAKIDFNGEYEMYHVGCLQDWFNTSSKGIITRFDVKSYTIYDENNVLIETVKLNQNDDIIIDIKKEETPQDHTANELFFLEEQPVRLDEQPRDCNYYTGWQNCMNNSRQCGSLIILCLISLAISFLYYGIKYLFT
jgi:hypothetical protein